MILLPPSESFREREPSDNRPCKEARDPCHVTTDDVHVHVHELPVFWMLSLLLTNCDNVTFPILSRTTVLILLYRSTF